MSFTQSWGLFADWWAMSLTMTLGSFVAGSTPAGGGAVAFPVLTKFLQIPAPEARTFGLMIQSIGMSMASLFIISQKIPFYKSVVLSAAPGGILGMTLGALFVHLPFPYPRIVFTCMVTMFGLAFHISHWILKHEPNYHAHRWEKNSNVHFFLAGIAGGIISSLCGSGIDMIVYIVMTLAYGMHEKKAIPTSVISMTLISLYGFFWHGVVVQSITIEWSYWAVCVPIVAMGAPMGAYVASKVSRDWILAGFTLLIVIDLISTIVLIENNAMTIGVMALMVVLSSLAFWAMMHWRQKELNNKPEACVTDFLVEGAEKKSEPS